MKFSCEHDNCHDSESRWPILLRKGELNMRTNRFIHELLGNDLRSLGKSSSVLTAVNDQESFDELFELIFHHERPLVMRSVDAVEKITSKHPEYLNPHKRQLLNILKSADHKELKWHIAQLITRIELNKKELENVWHILVYWALNKNESKIVRVNSLQGLFDLSIQHAELRKDFAGVIKRMERELIPSIQARVRKLKKTMH